MQPSISNKSPHRTGFSSRGSFGPSGSFVPSSVNSWDSSGWESTERASTGNFPTGLKPSVVGEHSGSWVWQQRLTRASKHGVCVHSLEGAKWQRLVQSSHRYGETGTGPSTAAPSGIYLFVALFFLGVRRRLLQNTTRLVSFAIAKYSLKGIVPSFVLHPNTDPLSLLRTMVSLSLLCVQWIHLVYHQMFQRDSRARSVAALTFRIVRSPLLSVYASLPGLQSSFKA